MTAGINRHTCNPLAGWAHVQQSLGVIFTTRIGSRILARFFGSAVPGLLGKNLTPQTLLKFWTAIAIAIELWEPRFRLRSITYPGATNSAQKARQGQIGIRMIGEYMPNALEGDFTVESTKTTSV